VGRALGRTARLLECSAAVVLVRWWTDGCQYCAATPDARGARAPPKEGLVVIGYHPKPPREVSDRKILVVADQLGFGGPIAVDREWSTLDRYWLGGHPERTWTSVSFLIDRAGVIRWFHGGGEYHASTARGISCDLEYELERTATRGAGGPAVHERRRASRLPPVPRTRRTTTNSPPQAAARPLRVWRLGEMARSSAKKARPLPP
jgi:hypothetical protein